MTLAAAARAMLDAFGGNVPDWLLPEADRLAQELAATEADTQGPHIAALEHMRAARQHFVAVQDVRTVRKVDEALRAVERAAGRLTLPHAEELAREEYRRAELPDPVSPERNRSDGKEAEELD